MAITEQAALFKLRNSDAYNVMARLTYSSLDLVTSRFPQLVKRGQTEIGQIWWAYQSIDVRYLHCFGKIETVVQ